MEVETARPTPKADKPPVDQPKVQPPKPVFGPPIFGKDKKQKLQSLREGLTQVFGRFEEVAPLLNHHDKTLGVTASPLTPATTKGPFTYPKEPSAPANDAKPSKAHSSSKSDSHSKSGHRKAKDTERGRSKDSKRESSNKPQPNGLLSIKITPPEPQPPSSDAGFKTPPISPRMAIKSMQCLVETPLSAIRGDKFKFGRQELTPDKSPVCDPKISDTLHTLPTNSHPSKPKVKRATSIVTQDLFLSDSSDSDEDDSSNERSLATNAAPKNDASVGMDTDTKQVGSASNSKADDPWGSLFNLYLPPSNGSKAGGSTKSESKKKKKDKNHLNDGSKSSGKKRSKNNSGAEEAPPPEPMRSPDSGFVEGSSPSASCKENKDKLKSTRSILDEARVSPLLSPLRQFPELVYKDDQPSLKCRLNLALVANRSQLFPPAKEANSTFSDIDDVPLSERQLDPVRVPKSQAPPPPPPSQSKATDQRAVTRDKAVDKNDAGCYKATKRKKKEEQECSQPTVKKPKPETNEECSSSGASVASIEPKPDKAQTMDGELKSPDYYQHERARPLKHKADEQSDKITRALLYLESIVYFIMTVRAMEREAKASSSRPYAMVKDTFELLRAITASLVRQASDLPQSQRHVARIQALSLRVQAILCYKMYVSREQAVARNYQQLNEYERKRRQQGSSQTSQDAGYASGSGGSSASTSTTTPSPTPSPASSTASGGSVPPGHVSIPQPVETMYRQQLTHLNNLMWAHRYWDTAERDSKTQDLGFFSHLDSLCGSLRLESSLESLCIYLLTAVHWIRVLCQES